MATSDPIMTLQSVSAGYPGQPVLHEVSLAVECGQVLGLLGPNGCGKTTLLRVMSGIMKSHASQADGGVTLEGRALLSHSRPELARAIACLTVFPRGRSTATPFILTVM